MAKKTGRLKKTTAKKTKTAARKAKRTAPSVARSRFVPDATVTWTGKDNPFREGSGAWERTETVRKASGQQVQTVAAKPGLRRSTLATLARMKLIEVR